MKLISFDKFINYRHKGLSFYELGLKDFHSEILFLEWFKKSLQECESMVDQQTADDAKKSLEDSHKFLYENLFDIDVYQYGPDPGYDEQSIGILTYYLAEYYRNKQIYLSGLLIINSNSLSDAKVKNGKNWKIEEPQKTQWLYQTYCYAFGPEVEFKSDWKTSDTVALARGICAERAFDRMPILADALQDAGCDEPKIINHLQNDTKFFTCADWVLINLLKIDTH